MHTYTYRNEMWHGEGRRALWVFFLFLSWVALKSALCSQLAAYARISQSFDPKNTAAYRGTYLKGRNICTHIHIEMKCASKITTTNMYAYIEAFATQIFSTVSYFEIRYLLNENLFCVQYSAVNRYRFDYVSGMDRLHYALCVFYCEWL